MEKELEDRFNRLEAKIDTFLERQSKSERELAVMSEKQLNDKRSLDAIHDKHRICQAERVSLQASFDHTLIEIQARQKVQAWIWGGCMAFVGGVPGIAAIWMILNK